MFPLLSKWMLPVAPVASSLISWLCYARGLPADASLCLFVAIVCALWWIFECAHIAIVGLLPFVAFPLFGVLSHKEVAGSYGHTMILLLMGGFFLSASMEKSGAHRRIALTMVHAVGGKGGKRLVLGFMLATSLLSMWISNAATTLMILPIALAVLERANDPKLRTPLMLGIAYAASIGGMATPIGTPPNVIFMGFMEDRFDVDVSFGGWMLVGLPIVALLFPFIWIWVTRTLGEAKPVEMPEVGPWRPSEKRVLFVFAATALLWMFRTGPFGGWSAWMPNGGETIGDTTVALAASLLLFLCPSGEAKPPVGDVTNDSPGKERSNSEETKPFHSAAPQTLLDWKTASSIPWGILIMFGGGLALAAGFEQTGLSKAIGTQLNVFGSAPPWVIVLCVCLLVTFLTEITSSTATATLMMPILAELAVAVQMEPTRILIPGTISASCAFMLPVATAPNVIVFWRWGNSH